MTNLNKFISQQPYQKQIGLIFEQLNYIEKEGGKNAPLDILTIIMSSFIKRNFPSDPEAQKTLKIICTAMKEYLEE